MISPPTTPECFQWIIKKIKIKNWICKTNEIPPPVEEDCSQPGKADWRQSKDLEVYNCSILYLGMYGRLC